MRPRKKQQKHGQGRGPQAADGPAGTPPRPAHDAPKTSEPNAESESARDAPDLGFSILIHREKNNPLVVVAHIFVILLLFQGSQASFCFFSSFLLFLEALFASCLFVANFLRNKFDAEGPILFWGLHAAFGACYLQALLLPESNYDDRQRLTGLSSLALRLRVLVAASSITLYAIYKRKLICATFFAWNTNASLLSRRANIAFQLFSPAIAFVFWTCFFSPRGEYRLFRTDLSILPIHSVVILGAVNGFLYFLYYRSWSRWKSCIWLDRHSFLAVVDTR